MEAIDPKKLAKLRRKHAENVRRKRRDARYPRCEVWMFGRKGAPGPHRCTERGTFGIVHDVEHGGPYRVCGTHGRRPDLWTFTPEAAIRRHRARRDVPEYETTRPLA